MKTTFTLALFTSIALCPIIEASTIFTTFGPGQTFDLASSYGVASVQGVASSFQPLFTATLNVIDVAMSYSSGTNSFNIILAANGSGVPGATIESFNVTGVGGVGTIETVNSTLHPLLSTGTTYWIEVLPGSANSVGAWNRNNQGLLGNQALLSSGSWNAQVGDRMNAFDVQGTGVPEPSSLSLFILSIPLVLMRRKRT